jgi:hypothetical protein
MKFAKTRAIWMPSKKLKNLGCHQKKSKSGAIKKKKILPKINGLKIKSLWHTTNQPKST